MKPFYKTLFFFSILLSSRLVRCQEIQVNPNANYFLAGRLNGYYADALFDNGANFGLGVSYGLGKGKHIEVSYTFAKSGAVLRRNDTGKYEDATGMNFGYIQAGYVQEIIPKGLPKMRPFGLFTIGAAYLNAEDPSYLTEWKFAAAIGGGIKYFITDLIGFRVQARLLMPLFFSDISGGCSSYGCEAGLNSFTSLAQGDVGGGLVLRFGTKD